MVPVVIVACHLQFLNRQEASIEKVKANLTFLTEELMPSKEFWVLSPGWLRDGPGGGLDRVRPCSKRTMCRCKWHDSNDMCGFRLCTPLISFPYRQDREDMGCDRDQCSRNCWDCGSSIVFVPLWRSMFGACDSIVSGAFGARLKQRWKIQLYLSSYAQHQELKTAEIWKVTHWNSSFQLDSLENRKTTQGTRWTYQEGSLFYMLAM